MAASDSVTSWVLCLRAGDPAAAERLWERYFCQMVAFARRQVRPELRRAADEEDVALSAFNSFCRGLERGRFPRLGDRDNLWRLLAALTARKAGHLVRRETAQKRGGPGVPDLGLDLSLVIGREPTPEDAVLVAEECRRCLDQLGDDSLRAVTLLATGGGGVFPYAGWVGPGEMTVWDATTGEETLTIRGRTLAVSSVCFSKLLLAVERAARAARSTANQAHFPLVDQDVGDDRGAFGPRPVAR